MKRIEKLDKNFAVPAAAPKDDLRWIEAHDRRLAIRGLAWVGENGPGFERLPRRAEKLVRPPVWELARMPASARVCFATDSTRLSVRVTNAAPSGMPHMPATGQSGVALYAGDPGQIRPWSVAVPEIQKPGFERPLFTGLARRMREFTLYLPLYNALQALDIGVDPKARFGKPSPLAHPKPVVFYGTSITQGGCASTPGADYVSTLGRILNLDVVNLGFSGNGMCDLEVADLMGELDAALFVFCSLANTPVAQLPAKLPPFYERLRRRRPATPILLLSRTPYSFAELSRAALDSEDAYRDTMIHFYSKTRLAGDANVHFADGAALIPFGTSGAHVDGCHPADHGFQLMAERLAPSIRRILFADALLTS